MGKQASTAHHLTVDFPGGTYPVLLGSGLLDQVGPLLRDADPALGDRALVVTDSNVEPLYAARVVHSLLAGGLHASTFVLPAGENSKRLANVANLYDACVRSKLDRRSPILALGGGVVGDVAGLVAATFLRGLPFLQVPTTLLAMVDSSIGGKVGVDLPQGKNLVGAFKQPIAVVMDTSCLASLPERELRGGCAEIIKAALLRGDAALEELQGLADAVVESGWHSTETMTRLLSAVNEALLCKRSIVVADPFEQGPRALLNLGHTFGHAIESWSRYEISHGEAVSMGLLCALRLSLARGLCRPALVSQVASLLTRLRLPTRLPRAAAAAQEILAAMQQDKKRSADTLRFILVRGPGDVFVDSGVSEAEVVATLGLLDPNHSLVAR